LIPVQSNSKENVEEVILTSLVSALSDRFHGAYEELAFYEFDDEEIKD
jgi:hypothetical protein